MDSEGDAITSSSSSFTGDEYEVFLNFRGLDTRHTFTDFLYTHLDNVGIHTFRDNNEIQKGKEIGPELLKAIKESKISIPILSKNYASSKWCLRELAKMVQCKRTTGQLILPIFYDVQPCDVKHQSGVYEEAFREHDNCFDQRTVKEWKEALGEVGALKGWEVMKEADGYQGKLIKEKIVPTILLELKKNYMVLTENLVGIIHHENQMMGLLDGVTNDVRIVGIHGMGGIGKTTIAKFIYNKLVERFQCHSFLTDVRETAQQYKGLVSLQKQLLIDTLNWCHDIFDVDSGIKVIKNRFKKKKVLIVLDDVNERSQFDWLVGKRDWFGTGSTIIITSRDKHVFNVIEVDAAYEPSFMNFMQSLQLFSIHAFRKKFTPKDYDSISKEIVSTAAGLPLALEVIGSFLFDKNKSVWEDTLKKLKKIPDVQVQKKLRISYDALNYEQQQIFLDVACFFIGMNKTPAFYMWDDCSYYPEKEINVLCLMSLIKMGDDNVLRMHDQFRDLGREIVRQENFRNPGKRSRLWDQEEALEILKRRRGSEEVEAMSLPFGLGEKNAHLTNEDLAELSDLRYLQMDGANLVGDFKHLLSRLRWLRWNSCPRHFKPTNFYLQNLVILDLSHGNIREGWKGWSQIKKANKLKFLDLRHSALRRTPDFSAYATLEILNLKQCGKLTKIDPSIGNLKNLKELNISCTSIKKLPDEIWMLEKLEVMDASYCWSLRGYIPSHMGRLSSLRFLSFHEAQIQSLPTTIGELSCLQTLDLHECMELQSLPDLPSSLKSLRVPCCIPNLSNLVNLEELEFRGCPEHVLIPIEIGKLSKLEKLEFQFTNIRTLPKEIGTLSQLKVLDILYCDKLQCIFGLPSSLVELSIDHCKSLERLPNLSNLKKLLTLSILRCGMLTMIQGLGELISLSSLKISWCHKLAKLDLLQRLDMIECRYLENEPDLSSLNKLKTIDIFICVKLNMIEGLDKLESLEYLSVTGCNSITRLPNLSNLKMLRRLNLSGCMKLREIEGLEALEALEEVDVSRCPSLQKTPCLNNKDIKVHAVV